MAAARSHVDLCKACPSPIVVGARVGARGGDGPPFGELPQQRPCAQLAEQFAAFFNRKDSFALGVCNGCQMLSQLKALIPGAEAWPRFLRNHSEQFEARFSLVEVVESPSILLAGMAGSRIPVVVSHGEGRAAFSAETDLAAAAVSLRYIDNAGDLASNYPANPNGSPMGITGLTSTDGRATLMMPHPERVAFSKQMSWHPKEWGELSPWMQLSSPSSSSRWKGMYLPSSCS